MIRYTFRFADDESLEFVFDEDADISPDITADPVPEWMGLERFRCEDCSLPPKSRRTCPAAIAMRPMLEGFSKRDSFERVHVRAEVREVTLESTTTLQRAVSSLMGLALPLSSCPVMNKARPLAYLHVPFAVRPYVAFRFLGMHFIAQYLRARDGLEPDWDLKEFLSLVRAMRRVHSRLAERIRAAAARDATVNSLLLLDAVVDSIELSVESSLDWMRPLFRVHLDKNQV